MAEVENDDALKKRFEEKWAERKRKRLELAGKRLENQEESTVLRKDLEEWLTSIRKSVVEAKEGADLDPVKITAVLDDVITDISNFERYFNENKNRISSAYDVRQIQLALNDVRLDFVALQELLQPKKKFGFKSKLKSKTSNQTKKKPEISERTINDDNSFKVDKDNLEVEEEKVEDRDVIVDGLSDCTVKLYGNPSTVHATNLKRVTLLCGPVKTSVFLENCTSCTFALACQQLRTHSTTESDFYIHVVAKAIIEDCKNVRFGPYNLTYPKLDEHYKKSGLNRNANAWDEIDDFNWLSSDVRSPNWSLIPEHERKTQFMN